MLFTIKSSKAQLTTPAVNTKERISMIKSPSKVRTRTIVHNVKLPNGCTYSGELLDGKLDGEGNLTYADNSHYEGTFMQGVKHGRGKYYYHSGELYIGDWVNNKKEGHGIYFYDKDKRYEGGFKNNMKHGKGRIYQTNGNLFQGEFSQNCKNGQGTYYDAVKDRFTKLIFSKGELIKSTQMPCESALASLKETQEPKDVSKDLMLEFLPSDPDKIISRIVSNYFEGRVKTNQSLFGSQGDEANNIVSWHQCQNPSQSRFTIQIYESPQIQRGVPELRSENLRGKRIDLWGIDQVCEWLEEIQFADFVTQFKFQQVEGLALLKLTNNDLIQLGIASQSDRIVLTRQLKFLQMFFKSQCLEDKVCKLQNLKFDTSLLKLLTTNNPRLKKQVKQDGPQRKSVQFKESQVKQIKTERKKSKDQKIQTMTPRVENKQTVTDNQSSSSSLSQSDNQNQKQLDKAIQNNKAEKKRRRKLNIQRKIDNLMKQKRIGLSIISREQIVICKTIGKGSYGQVFLAEWMGQDIAVKRYMKRRGIRNRHIAHFIQEAEITNKLLHPNIVLFMGMFVYDNEYAIVMEYLSRGSLFDYLHIKGYKPVESRIISFCLDIAVGMVYLHGKFIIHCDLKSSNLLINQNWKVKISDFGLSQIIKLRQSKSKKAMKMGAPQWMAPQIMRGEKYEFASDVYSFGIVLWELMTCQIPFREYPQREIFDQVGNKQTLTLGPPDYPNANLVHLFKQCTARQSSDRPTFNQVVIKLRNIKKELQEAKKKL